jgi:DNA-binding response OmpR family regulator
MGPVDEQTSGVVVVKFTPSPDDEVALTMSAGSLSVRAPRGANVIVCGVVPNADPADQLTTGATSALAANTITATAARRRLLDSPLGTPRTVPARRRTDAAIRVVGSGDHRSRGMVMRVLLAEDDAPLADVIARGLRRAALSVDIARDGGSALERAQSVEYDVIVLDRDLPVLHGDAVCEALNASGALSRILMLTASAAIEERVEGLALGADDYLPKPFAMAELVARIRALGRRSMRARPKILEFGDVWLDPARRRAGRGTDELRLTNREFALLEQLMIEPGATLSAEVLMARVWDDRVDPFSNIVRVTMLTLRRKLGDPAVIETVPRFGYRLA